MWDLYFPFPSSLTTSPFLSSGDFTLKACLRSVCAVFGLCHSEFSLDYHAFSSGLLRQPPHFLFFFFFCFFYMKCSSSIISQCWPSLLSDIPGNVPSCRALFIIFLPFHAGLRDSLSNPYFFSSLHLPSWPFLIYLVDYWLSFWGEYNVHEVRDLISSVKPMEPRLRVQNMIDT